MRDKEKLSVDVDAEFIIVEDENGKFIKGKKRPSYGLKKQIENINKPEEARYKGKKDVIVKFNEYDPKKDQDILILRKMLTEWSHDKEISGRNIVEEVELGPFFDKFVEEFKEINDIGQNDEDEEDAEKKQNENED